jgi:hypothetical protein
VSVDAFSDEVSTENIYLLILCRQIDLIVLWIIVFVSKTHLCVGADEQTEF